MSELTPLQSYAATAVSMDYNGRPYRLGKADCATLCADYWEIVTGDKLTLPRLPKPSVKAVKAVLGEPAKDVQPGDVVLTKEHLGINLGYCVLTMLEDSGVGRVPTTSCIAWRPQDG